jgi:hypothetical protein
VDFFELISVLIARNMTLYFVLLIPFLAIAFRLFFKSLGLIEHFIALGFAWGHVILGLIPLTILVFIPLQWVGVDMRHFTFFTFAAVPILYAYFTWMYKQLTNGSWGKTILRLMGAVYSGYLFFFGISFLFFLIARVTFHG